MAELLLGVPAPILYWEQGHEWLFGDPVRFQVESNPPFSPWTPRLTARWSRLSVSPAVGTRLSAQAAHNYLEQDQLFHMAMHLPVALASVSTAVQDILKQEFRRESLLLPNSIDCERFRPGPKSGNWALAGVPAKKRKVPPPPPPSGSAAAFSRIPIALLHPIPAPASPDPPVPCAAPAPGTARRQPDAPAQGLRRGDCGAAGCQLRHSYSRHLDMPG